MKNNFYNFDYWLIELLIKPYSLKVKAKLLTIAYEAIHNLFFQFLTSSMTAFATFPSPLQSVWPPCYSPKPHHVLILLSMSDPVLHSPEIIFTKLSAQITPSHPSMQILFLTEVYYDFILFNTATAQL
jgi:hypothetical protein